MKNKEEKKRFIKKLGEKIKKIVQLIFNPRFLFCFGIAWIATNGWAYVMLGVGIITGIGWMSAVSSAYLALIWLPGTPEKIFTLALSIFILKKIFPKDQKTLAVLYGWYKKAKDDIYKLKSKMRKKRELKNSAKETDTKTKNCEK